nr:hypothetical protein [Tanacetum cinerariifolium]
MDNMKHIVDLESFKDMLHICPRVHGQSFAEPPFEEEILAFIRFLGHSAAIKTLTDVEHKNSKKSNEMHYPRFTKVIIHHFMSKDPSIARRNKELHHLSLRLVSEGPEVVLTHLFSSNSAAGLRVTSSQKGKQAAKASKAKSLSALSEVAMTEAQQLKLVTKKSTQQTHISQASGFGVDEGTGSIQGVPDVKEQVKVQVSKILPRIEQNVNEQLEVEVLTLSSHSSKTSYVVAADLSEMELKNILIKKMEGNTYGETITLKRRRDDNDDKDEEPSTGLDRGSKRCRDGKEPESASAPMEIATRSIGRSTQRSQSRQASANESAFAEEPVQTTCQMEEPSHPEFDTSSKDQPIVKSSQHPKWFSQ